MKVTVTIERSEAELLLIRKKGGRKWERTIWEFEGVPDGESFFVRATSDIDDSGPIDVVIGGEFSIAGKWTQEAAFRGEGKW